MSKLAAICGYCEATLAAGAAGEHFERWHPGMDWSLVTWPDGTTVHVGDDLDDELRELAR